MGTITVKATYYANTGDIEDDVVFSFRTPFYLHEGVKVQYDDELYEVSESFWNSDKDINECIFILATPKQQ